MVFLYESLTPTYVVYCDDLDLKAAQRIAARKGIPLLSTAKDKAPSVYDPLYDESNLILVGGWYPNPYTRYYFYNPGLVKDDPTQEILIGEGVYADGKRYIHTIMRPNGTTVTAVFGWHKEDTLQAAYDLTKIDLKPIAIGAGIVTIVVGAVAVYGSRAAT